ncbi:sugar-binding transcriptional regulator [Niallia sp. SS-2023]|nr:MULTISPECIES: sugar-binding transcriptional regulator [unclassified Niallia]MCE4047629.1 sugar-binding transcriptional regulator [Bacillus sp. Au-Bac7]MCM3031075.1 sugar-binding transcriptional regulator [Niallia sp. MER 6]MDL0437368.1 sugar-binding transcriptional regulator [Niallia sp. SS-2023]UPO86029.1 sugar-binding transcriptional regulator [Niallia sp. Man26]
MEWQEKRQLVKVSSMYYNDGWTQAQIAQKLGVSRPVISKLLQRAKDEGIVKIYIKDESVHTVELERKLEQYFDLADAVVVPNNGLSAERAKREVGQAGASYISNNMKDVKSIGISWGETLANLVQEYPFERKEDITVVPLEGGMGVKQVQIHANQLANELAKKLQSTCAYLYAPAIVETEELKQRLMGMEDIQTVLEIGRNVDVALIGIGNPFDDSTLLRLGYLQENDLAQLRDVGAIGDIGFRFFDQNGKPINDSLNTKVIGITLEEFKGIKNVIAVVEGEHKVASILGALQGKFIDVLITDELTANAIIKNIT